MFRRLFLSYLGLLVLALAVYGIVSAGSTRRRVEQDLELRLRIETETLRSLVRLAPDAAALQAALSELGRRSGMRLTVVGGDGVVLADSGADPALMDNHNDRPEIQAARAGAPASRVRYSDTVRADLVYLAALLDPSAPRGRVVRSAVPFDQVQAELRALYGGIALAFAVLATLGAAVTYGLARHVTRPLRALEAAARAIAAGEFDTRVALRERGEVASVASAMNVMAEELSARLRRLAAERSKLETVVASMQEGVIAVDGEGRILHINASARALFAIGADPADLKVWEVVRLPALEEAVRKVLREGAADRRAVESGPRTLSVLVSPVSSRGGAVLVARDVTEERRYDDLRREFVANVSHELRTPLSLIQGYAETLASGAWKDGEKAPEFLRVIESNAGRLTRIVEDLLDLSRFESGGQSPRRGRVDPVRLLEKLHEAYRPLAERKSQALVFEGAAEPLDTDPDLLERALSNLIDNAIKYTPEKGRIRVTAETSEGELRIRVEDTGIGIPEKDLPRVFERFYRVDKSRSRELGGTGLGLAIVKHVMQLLGGTVEAQSRPGAGSTFTLRVPVVPSGKT